jgi:DNA repair exonuclease SbcCD nuclease subunit
MGSFTMLIRFIGDVHGEFSELQKIVQPDALNFQVGDLGLGYSQLRGRGLNLVAIAGNHDNYQPDSPDYFRKQSWFLGDYGNLTIGEFEDMFYLRGAFSVDQGIRQRWQEEELSYSQFSDAIELYAATKPKFVVTHDLPTDLVPHVSDPRIVRQWGYDPETFRTRTGQALQKMFDSHQPDYWICGHYHRRTEFTVGKTQFIALDMLRDRSDNRDAYVDFDFLHI